MEERREEQRRTLKWPVVLEWAGRNITGEVTQLGRHNIFIDTEIPLPEGTELRTIFRIGEQVLNLQCRVKRTESRGFAAEFETLAPEQYNMLMGLL